MYFPHIRYIYINYLCDTCIYEYTYTNINKYISLWWKKYIKMKEIHTEYIEKGFGFFPGEWDYWLFIFFLYNVLYFSKVSRTPLTVQWLKHHTPNAGGPGSIPGQETRGHMMQLRAYTLPLRPGAAKRRELILFTAKKSEGYWKCRSRKDEKDRYFLFQVNYF